MMTAQGPNELFSPAGRLIGQGAAVVAATYRRKVSGNGSRLRISGRPLSGHDLAGSGRAVRAGATSTISGRPDSVRTTTLGDGLDS